MDIMNTNAQMLIDAFPFFYLNDLIKFFYASKAIFMPIIPDNFNCISNFQKKIMIICLRKLFIIYADGFQELQ